MILAREEMFAFDIEDNLFVYQNVYYYLISDPNAASKSITDNVNNGLISNKINHKNIVSI